MHKITIPAQSAVYANQTVICLYWLQCTDCDQIDFIPGQIRSGYLVHGSLRNNAAFDGVVENAGFPCFRKSIFERIACPLRNADDLIKFSVACDCLRNAAKRGRSCFRRLECAMDPAYQFCIRILATADHPGGRAALGGTASSRAMLGAA